MVRNKIKPKFMFDGIRISALFYVNITSLYGCLHVVTVKNYFFTKQGFTLKKI